MKAFQINNIFVIKIDFIYSFYIIAFIKKSGGIKMAKKNISLTRAFKNRIIIEYPRLLDYLKLTHRYFNESLTYVMRYYKWMEKGANGPLAQKFSPERAEEFRAIYYDMMGLPFQSNLINIKTTPKLCNDHLKKEIPPSIEEIKKCQSCKNKRQGRSQSAHGWFESITDDNPGIRWGSSQGISQDIKDIILKMREDIRAGKQKPLFNKNNFYCYIGADNGFPRYIFDAAARRLLNHEQNQITHEKILEDTKKEFEEWKLNEKTKFKEFENIALKEFLSYQKEKKIQITGAMIKSWGDIKEIWEKNDQANSNELIKLLKDFQTEHKLEIGDINFFEWLASKKILWDYVYTMKTYNYYINQIDKYSKPINFRYPDAYKSPEWMEFSAESPGHMYDIISINPFIVDLCIFIPNEDVLKLLPNKKTKTNPINRDILSPEAKELLNQPIKDFSPYFRKDEDVPEEMQGFAKNQKFIDPKKLTRLFVRFKIQPDRRIISKCIEFYPKAKGSQPDCKYNISSFPNLSIPVKAQFGTQRLLFKNNIPYLYLPIEFNSEDVEQSLPYLPQAPIFKKGENAEFPSEFRLMTIDLGQRFTACAVIIDAPTGKFNKILKGGVKFIKLPGIELPSISQHEYQKKFHQKKSADIKRKLTEKPKAAAKGESFDVSLMTHINNMKENRSKIAAHKIIEFALKNKVDVIAFENLQGYSPSQEFIRTVNKRLMIWNRREIVNWVDKIGAPFGYSSNYRTVNDKVNPAYTSQTCSHCGSYGVRFSKTTKQFFLRDLPTDKEKIDKAIKDFPYLKSFLSQYLTKPIGHRRHQSYKGFVEGMFQVIRGGKLFCCPNCKLICNADYNAAVNLAKKYLKIKFFENKKKFSDKEWKKFIKDIVDKSQIFLNQKFNQPKEVPPFGGWNDKHCFEDDKDKEDFPY